MTEIPKPLNVSRKLRWAPKMQRQAQCFHVIAIAAQNGLGQRQKLLFFKAGICGVGLYQLIRCGHVQINRTGLGNRPDRWLRVFTARLDLAA